VIKTPKGDVKELKIPAGTLKFIGAVNSVEVDVDTGAEMIMKASQAVRDVIDITGEPGTNVGGMMEEVRVVMGRLTDQETKEIRRSPTCWPWTPRSRRR
jgi:hypothetical protein